MTNMANDSMYYEEDNDCAVKALARIGAMSYNRAHAYCKSNGRQDKVAMSVGDFLNAVQATGAAILGFNVGKTLEDITTNQKKMTVKQMAKAFSDRHGQNFVAMTNDHVIAVCDGEVETSEVHNYARKRVQVICEVMSKEEADNIKAGFDRWGESYHKSDRDMGHHVYWEAV